MKQKRNKWDPKNKQRKQRRTLIVLGIVFALMLAWQGPKTWKSMHKKSLVDAQPAPTSVVGAPQGTAPGASPGASLASASKAVPPATDLVPVAGEGQLVGFSLFKTKDPFVTAVDASSSDPATAPESDPPASSPPASSPPASSPPASSEPPASEPPASEPPASSPPSDDPPALDPPAVDPPASEPPATEPPVTVPPTSEDPPAEDPPATSPPAPTPPPTPPASPPAPAPKPTSATISVNGVKEDVAISGVFPKDEQLFRLVSITDDVAQIAIAGGSYQDGAPTVSLTLGKPLTLMNTADGTRYVLRLLAVS